MKEKISFIVLIVGINCQVFWHFVNKFYISSVGSLMSFILLKLF